MCQRSPDPEPTSCSALDVLPVMVDPQLRAPVEPSVGNRVGMLVGLLVELAVGLAVGLQVGAAVGGAMQLLASVYVPSWLTTPSTTTV